jgi:putative Mg2+ transporter-C (MgtC) family protein
VSDWLAYVGLELNIIPHLAAQLVVYVLELPIVWDREQNERSARLGTFPLVEIGSCGFTRPSRPSPPGMRKRQQCRRRGHHGLVSISGGAILVGKLGTRGIATATSIWPTGAIRAAVSDWAPPIRRSCFRLLKTDTSIDASLQGEGEYVAAARQVLAAL